MQSESSSLRTSFKKALPKGDTLPGRTASFRCRTALRPNKFAIIGVLLLCGAGLCKEPRLAKSFRPKASPSAAPRPAPTVVNDFGVTFTDVAQLAGFRLPTV